MSEILIAACPPIGDVGPLPSVARGLAARGDRVTFMTSAKHAHQIRAVGAVNLLAANVFTPPSCWPEPDGARPVVHVPQRHRRNADLGRLIETTIEALADEGVPLVVAGNTEDKPEVAARVNAIALQYKYANLDSLAGIEALADGRHRRTPADPDAVTRTRSWSQS